VDTAFTRRWQRAAAVGKFGIGFKLDSHSPKEVV
jgi:hypothetical protein